MNISRLLVKYDRAVPRYTSYPTAPHFSALTNGAVYAGWLRALPDDTALSLYLHVPFYAALCRFCACHTTVVNRPETLEAYGDTLMAEIDLVADAIADFRIEGESCPIPGLRGVGGGVSGRGDGEAAGESVRRRPGWMFSPDRILPGRGRFLAGTAYRYRGEAADLADLSVQPSQRRGLGNGHHGSSRECAVPGPGNVNRGLIFVPGTDTWQGFVRRPIEGVRRSLIVNYVGLEWRSRQELAFPCHPVVSPRAAVGD